MLTKKSPSTILEAPDITAFITTRTGIFPTPILRESDSKVIFRFDEDVSVALTDFYDNVSVGILDYTKNLKACRSAIFNLKGSKKI